MELKRKNWTKKDYAEYLRYLKSFYNEKGKAFGEKLISTKYEILGMKMAEIRKIAKEISIGNYQEFLKFVQNKYYEETLIEGYVIEQTGDLDKIEDFLAKIDNWAICDSLSLKFMQKNKDKYFGWVLHFLKDKREYFCRFGLVMLLYFAEDKYIERILKEIDKVNLDYYYVKMGRAWLLQGLYVKCQKKTEAYLLKNNLDDWTFNKTISKIRESYRVSQDKKDYLNTLKRKVVK